jgi:hypothetical protein
MRLGIVIAFAFLSGCGDPPGDPGVQIDSASPDYGPLVGGTTITITGSGFRAAGAGASRVLIASREAPVASVIDDTRIEVVIPPGEQPGDAEVVVLNSAGSARALGIFHYSTPPTITGVTPETVLFSSTQTVMTVTGTGFLAEGASPVAVVVDNQLVTDVVVTSDTSLSFTAPLGRPFARPRVTVVALRGRAVLERSYRYTPSTRPGLLLFSAFGPSFAMFYDPADGSTVPIPWIAGASFRPTSITRDDHGDYWAIDRFQRFGRIDLDRQQLIEPIQSNAVIPTFARVGDRHVAIARIGGAQFGTFDPATGGFTGLATIPCCGSYGMAHDGTTLFFAARGGTDKAIAPLDPLTGETGTPIEITGVPGIHIEEMRFFQGTLYATSRDGRLVTIDPQTGIASVVANPGRFNAMEVYE